MIFFKLDKDEIRIEDQSRAGVTMCKYLFFAILNNERFEKIIKKREGKIVIFFYVGCRMLQETTFIEGGKYKSLENKELGTCISVGKTGAIFRLLKNHKSRLKVVKQTDWFKWEIIA